MHKTKTLGLSVRSSINSVLLISALAFGAGNRAGADLIAPKSTSGANQAQGVPESLVLDLDPALVEKIQPAILAFIANRDRESLKKSYEEVAGGTDTLPNFEVFLGRLFAAYNQFGEALGILERYTNENAEDPEAFLALGNIALVNGRAVDAWLHLLYAQRLVDRDKLPNGRKPFVLPVLTELRASVAERRKQWTESEQLFRELQKLKPDAVYPLWRAGRVKVLAGDTQAGFELLQQAHAKDSSLPYPSLVVAQTLHDTTDWKSDSKNTALVEDWYKKAIVETKDQPAAWSSYLKWLMLANRPEEVVQLYDELNESLKSEREIGLIRCVAARYLGDYSTAESLLSKLHQSNMEDVEVTDQLALVLVESTDEAKRARALQLAETNVKRASQLEPIVATAAWVQLRTGASDKAQQLFSQLAARGNLSPQTVYYMAEFMEKSGQTEEARRLLSLAVDAPGLFVQRSMVKQRLSGK